MAVFGRVWRAARIVGPSFIPRHPVACSTLLSLAATSTIAASSPLYCDSTSSVDGPDGPEGGDEKRDVGVYYDPATCKWTSTFKVNGQQRKLGLRATKEEAENDRAFVAACFSSTSTPAAVAHLSPEESAGREQAMDNLNRLYEDPSKITREQTLNYLQNLVKAVQPEAKDANMEWRLARAIFALTDSYFDSVETQLQLLEISQDWAERVLRHQPHHRQGHIWRSASQARRVQITNNLELKQYGLSDERRRELREAQALAKVSLW